MLPRDYLAFIDRIGAGSFSYGIFSIEVFDLLSSSGRHTVQEYLEIFGDRYSSPEFEEIYSDKDSISMYPDSDGLLPWGCDNEDTTFFWRTTGKPDSWTIAVDRRNYPDFFSCSFTEFLYEAVVGTQSFGHFLRMAELNEVPKFSPKDE